MRKGVLPFPRGLALLGGSRARSKLRCIEADPRARSKLSPWSAATATMTPNDAPEVVTHITLATAALVVARVADKFSMRRATSASPSTLPLPPCC